MIPIGNFIYVLIVVVSSSKLPFKIKISEQSIQNRVKNHVALWTALDKITIYSIITGSNTHADVAELADALDSGSSVLTDVEVRILSSALITRVSGQPTRNPCYVGRENTFINHSSRIANN